MALSRKIVAAGFATMALLATTIAASAAPAVVTGNVNVRSGPGTGYYAIDTIRRGERVDVQYCQGSWCFVEKRGPDGWVSASYLDRGRPGRPSRPDWDNDGPDWGNNGPGWGGNGPRPGWDNGPGWNGPGPGWGNGGGNGHHRPRPGGSVCFNGPDGYVCLGN